VLGDSESIMVPINNTLDEEDGDVTGIDAAIDVLSVSGGSSDPHPERRQKV
jgi:hypothetical protein